MSEKEKVAVIGSNSFSGADFIDLLLEQGSYSVIGLSRSPEKADYFLPYKKHRGADFTFHQMDLNNDMPEAVELFNSFRPAYIVNFAAQSEVAPSWDAPWQWFQTNAVSLAKLVHHMKDMKFLKRYVHISSPEVYGTCHGTVTEDAPLNPSTPYAASKAAADLLLFTYVKNFGFPMSMVRSTNVYGPGQQLFKIIPRSVIYIKSGKTIELHGGGSAVKSYIHIRDVSHGELSIMTKGRTGEIYHLSPKKGIAVRDVVDLICKRMEVDFDSATRMVGERLGQDAAYIIDSTKARQELGWEPVISIEQGISDVIGWVEAYWKDLKKEPHHYQHKA